MKNKMLLMVFLGLIFMSPGILQAAPSGGEAVEDSTLPKVNTYDELLASIRKARNASQARLEAAAEQEKVREAWETGKLIDEHVLHHQGRAEYGRQVLVRLAKDLGTSQTELSYMLQFARAYPMFPSTEILSWGHYRELLSVNDTKEREAIASEAVKNKWTQKEIRAEVKARKRKGDSLSETLK